MRRHSRSKELISSLFIWPDFIVYNDCVFLACQFTKREYRSWTKSLAARPLDKAAIEVSMNHIHVSEAFVSTPSRISRRLAKDVCAAVCESWRTKLLSDFPDREFDVNFFLADPPEMSEISFCQLKHKLFPVSKEKRR